MELIDPLPNSVVTMDTALKPIMHTDVMNFYCDLDIVCRICLDREQPNLKMCNIFDATKQVHVSAMIMSCASVQVLEGDGLPSTICQKCIAKLNLAWQFKIQCENSDAKLRQFYGSTPQLQVSPEVTDFNAKTGEENLYNILKTESNPPTCEGKIEINILAKETQVSNSNQQQNEKLNNSNSKKDDVANRKPPKQKSDKSKEVKIHQCDTCGKTFNRREYLTQHIRIHTGEKPYHCHLCEKRFVNSGHLTTHMRTHTGVRPHSCTLCPKAFSTRQELQKHTMVHNGERPFVCKMCGKRFGSSSNLYSHFKHHTGEKNFTCEHCGKAFYTKQELKQHLVVHTGEKAFL